MQPTCRPSTQPSSQPSRQPSGQPSSRPTRQPTSQPSTPPSGQPSGWPSNQPSTQPSSDPSSQPSIQPSGLPSSQPSGQPTTFPTSFPTGIPSSQPSSFPSSQPTLQPSSQPTGFPTAFPSSTPSIQPSSAPTSFPTSQPSTLPSSQPTGAPSGAPSGYPSGIPTEFPSSQPSCSPTMFPTSFPTGLPSMQPSAVPTETPSAQPSDSPSGQPTAYPSSQPISTPSSSPSIQPSSKPSSIPSCIPSNRPSTSPTATPSRIPSSQPSKRPSSLPTARPSIHPSAQPSAKPSPLPSSFPSSQPTFSPSARPSVFPSIQPSSQPTDSPSGSPSSSPSFQPTARPTTSPTEQYSASPSSCPSSNPSSQPTVSPTNKRTLQSGLSVFPQHVLFKQTLFLFDTLPGTRDVLQNITVRGGETGESYLIYGSDSFSSTISLIRGVQDDDSTDYVRLSSAISTEDNIPRSIDCSGDINNDRRSDILIGDPFNSRVFVLFGKQEGLASLDSGFTIRGEATQDYFGWSVSSGFDWNGDGYDDIIVGAILKNAAYVIFGKDDTRPLNITGRSNNWTNTSDGVVKLVGNKKMTKTGMSVSSAGDFNGDGLDDVMLSASTSNSGNVIYILYGSRSPLSRMLSLDGLSADRGIRIYGSALSFSGISVSWLGDVNGDGLADVAIGSLPFSKGYTTQVSYVIYGRRNQTVSSELMLSEVGGEIGSKILGGGIIVSGASDVDKDGKNDILITNYGDWQGKSGVFMIQYPSILSRSPSIQPSSHPSSLTTPIVISSRSPSLLPSRLPTYVPSSPTVVPSLAPSGPTDAPTIAPSSPTLIPSNVPIPVPSRKPTRTPQIKHPSFAPSISSPAPTVKPSRPPSRRPTIAPTAKPSTFPSSRPSFFSNDDNNDFVIIKITDKGTTVINNTSSNGGDGVNREYIIAVSNSTKVTGEGRRNKYVIKSVDATTVTTITNFNPNHDVIDLSAFPSIRNVSDLFIMEDPLTLILPNGQEVVLSSMSNYNLNPSNFVFSTARESPSITTSGSVTILSRSVLITLAALGALVCMSFIILNHTGRQSSAKQTNSFHGRRHFDSNSPTHNRIPLLFPSLQQPQPEKDPGPSLTKFISQNNREKRDELAAMQMQSQTEEYVENRLVSTEYSEEIYSEGRLQWEHSFPVVSDINRLENSMLSSHSSTSNCKEANSPVKPTSETMKGSETHPFSHDSISISSENLSYLSEDYVLSISSSESHLIVRSNEENVIMINNKLVERDERAGDEDLMEWGMIRTKSITKDSYFPPRSIDSSRSLSVFPQLSTFVTRPNNDHPDHHHSDSDIDHRSHSSSSSASTEKDHDEDDTNDSSDRDTISGDDDSQFL